MHKQHVGIVVEIWPQCTFKAEVNEANKVKIKILKVKYEKR